MRKVLMGIAAILVCGSVLADSVLVCSGSGVLESRVSDPEKTASHFTVVVAENIWGNIIDVSISGDMTGVYYVTGGPRNRQLILEDSSYVMYDDKNLLTIDRHSGRFTYVSASDAAPHHLRKNTTGQCKVSNEKM